MSNHQLIRRGKKTNSSNIIPSLLEVGIFPFSFDEEIKTFILFITIIIFAFIIHYSSDSGSWFMYQ